MLVSTFYNKIKKDDFISHFFINAIPVNEWEHHIDKLTNFWKTNLFLTRSYKGNPMRVHKILISCVINQKGDILKKITKQIDNNEILILKENTFYQKLLLLYEN